VRHTVPAAEGLERSPHWPRALAANLAYRYVPEFYGIGYGEGSRFPHLDHQALLNTPSYERNFSFIVHCIELGAIFWLEVFPNNTHSSFKERPTRPPELRADIIRVRIAAALETHPETLVVRIRF